MSMEQVLHTSYRQTDKNLALVSKGRVEALRADSGKPRPEGLKRPWNWLPLVPLRYKGTAWSWYVGRAKRSEKPPDEKDRARSGLVPRVPPTAVTNGQDPGKTASNLVLLVPSLDTHVLPGPLSPLAANMVTPLAPRAPNWLQICWTYPSGRDCSFSPNEVVIVWGS